MNKYHEHPYLYGARFVLLVKFLDLSIIVLALVVTTDYIKQGIIMIPAIVLAETILNTLYIKSNTVRIIPTFQGVYPRTRSR